jgi:hypothetical protein
MGHERGTPGAPRSKCASYLLFVRSELTPTRALTFLRAVSKFCCVKTPEELVISALAWFGTSSVIGVFLVTSSQSFVLAELIPRFVVGVTWFLLEF